MRDGRLSTIAYAAGLGFRTMADSSQSPIRQASVWLNCQLGRLGFSLWQISGRVGYLGVVREGKFFRLKGFLQYEGNCLGYPPGDGLWCEGSGVGCKGVIVEAV